MKLDKIKFARLVQFITSLDHQNHLDLNELDAIIDIDLPEQPQYMLNPETLHVLMALMAEGTSKIETIKQHRMMTGYGLKESKDIVEKYWVVKKQYDKVDLLNKVNLLSRNDTEQEIMTNFINQL